MNNGIVLTFSLRFMGQCVRHYGNAAGSESCNGNYGTVLTTLVQCENG